VDPRALKRWGLRALILLGCGAGVWALLLLLQVTENSADFNRRQPWILLLNTCAVLALGVLLTRKLWQLYRDFRTTCPVRASPPAPWACSAPWWWCRC
jgi:hypothetical protein